jgi:hypothetical protein
MFTLKKKELTEGQKHFWSKLASSFVMNFKYLFIFLILALIPSALRADFCTINCNPLTGSCKCWEPAFTCDLSRGDCVGVGQYKICNGACVMAG